LTSYPDDIRQRRARREVVRVAVGEHHRLADREQIDLGSLRNETLELSPREIAPGYYDAIIAACHTAGYEPKVDQHGAGSTVWGYIAEGRGVGLVVSSLIEQLPRGVKLLDLAPPRPMLTVNAVWREDHELPGDRALLRNRETPPQERQWALAARTRARAWVNDNYALSASNNLRFSFDFSAPALGVGLEHVGSAGRCWWPSAECRRRWL
jgi:DNA-binding transcriptional LysR family regulator